MSKKYYLFPRHTNYKQEPKEAPKPFYKNSSDLIALTAILLSIFTIVYTTVKDNFSEHDAIRKEMRESVASLQLLEKESAKEAELLNQSVELYISNHPKLITQIEVLLDNINVLNEKTRKDFSTEFYNYIAFVYNHYSSRSNRTFKYYDQALEVAQDALDTSNVYMNRYIMHYDQGLYFDTIKARAFLDKDIQSLKNFRSDFSNVFIVKDYANAAEKESAINPANCFRFLDSAIAYARTFEKKPSMYEHLKGRINEAIRVIKSDCNEDYCKIAWL